MRRPFALGVLAAMSAFAANSVHEFQMKSIDGKSVSLADYRGKALLIVNVASRCGYTPQYEGLQKLHEKYARQGLVVLGFPANEFGAQEPGSDAEIAQFCKRSYGVSFPMFSKIVVKGEGKHPLYQHLTAATGQEIPWNFTKFLVGKDGQVIRCFEPKTDPLDGELTAAVEQALR